MDNSLGDDDWTIPSTVDTESFLGEGMDFKVLDLSVAPCHDVIGVDSKKSTTRACVTIKAADIPDDEDKRAPVDIVVSLDVSASMSGSKIDLCKLTLELLIRHLISKDRFGLVVYGYEAKICIPASLATPEMKRVALEKIKAIRVGGGTNMSAGLTLAAQEMNSIGTPNQVRSIFLLTDGYANCGVTDTPTLVSIVKNFTSPDILVPTGPFQNICLEAGGCDSSAAALTTKPTGMTVETSPPSPPISLHCFGYGQVHESDMLQKMANASPGGTYYFVETDSNVLTAFGDALGGITSVVAQSAVLSIAVPPTAAARGVSIVSVYHDETIKREDGSYTVLVGDFYAEETRDVLFELTLAGGDPGTAPVPHAIISLSYADTIQSTSCKAGPLVCAITRSQGSEVSASNVHVETQWLRVQAVREMQAADLEAQNNQLEAAQSRMTALKELFAMSPPHVLEASSTVSLLADITAVSNEFRTTADYRSSGSHSVQAKAMGLRKQRCSEATTLVPNAYRTGKKAKMSSKFQSA